MSKPTAPPLDWLSFPSPTVVEAPHPDLFEFELDNSLSTFDQGQVQVVALDYSQDQFHFFRTDTPHGPGSTITVSSESAYETLSNYSESFYNYPTQTTVDPQFAQDLALDFTKFAVDSDNISNHGLHTMDPTRDGAFHPLQPSYEPAMPYVDTSAVYELAGAAGADGSLFPANSAYVPSQGTIAPSNIAPRGASSSSESPVSSDGHHADSDPRKKYPCPSCSRSFARAYNLKTHLATHDPNRLKPYVCSHRACGRSFSRKHDLGRHLVSIHRDETGSAYSVGSAHSESERKPVGLAADKGPRVWCDDCGRGWVGHQRGCSCAAIDVK